MKAKYSLFWYELDQPIAVGMTDSFDFIKGEEPLRFHRGPRTSAEIEAVNCSIEAIRHPELGAVRKIDTEGLEYTITLLDGRSFRVEAEETPGDVRDFPIKPTNWEFDVELQISRDHRKGVNPTSG